MNIKILLSVIAIAWGFICYKFIKNKKKNIEKTKREVTTFDIWDNIGWKIGIVIGFLGLIILVIELYNFCF